MSGIAHLFYPWGFQQWLQKILDKKRTLPSYLKRIERPWFRKAADLENELKAD